MNSVSQGKISNEIHTKGALATRGCNEGRQRRCTPGTISLIHLARNTTSDIIVYITVHARSVKLQLEHVERALDDHVSHPGYVVMRVKDILAQNFNVRNVKPIIALNQSV